MALSHVLVDDHEVAPAFGVGQEADDDLLPVHLGQDRVGGQRLAFEGELAHVVNAVRFELAQRGSQAVKLEVEGPDLVVMVRRLAVLADDRVTKSAGRREVGEVTHAARSVGERRVHEEPEVVERRIAVCSVRVHERRDQHDIPEG